MNSLQRLKKDESGAVMVMFSVFLTLFFIPLTISTLNLGEFYVDKSAIQIAADSAAIAASSSVKVVKDTYIDNVSAVCPNVLSQQKTGFDYTGTVEHNDITPNQVYNAVNQFLQENHFNGLSNLSIKTVEVKDHYADNANYSYNGSDQTFYNQKIPSFASTNSPDVSVGITLSATFTPIVDLFFRPSLISASSGSLHMFTGSAPTYHSIVLSCPPITKTKTSQLPNPPSAGGLPSQVNGGGVGANGKLGGRNSGNGGAGTGVVTATNIPSVIAASNGSSGRTNTRGTSAGGSKTVGGGKTPKPNLSGGSVRQSGGWRIRAVP